MKSIKEKSMNESRRTKVITLFSHQLYNICYHVFLQITAKLFYMTVHDRNVGIIQQRGTNLEGIKEKALAMISIVK